MQFKDQVSLFPISDRYELYCIAKRHLRGTPRPKVFPIEGSSKKTLEQRGGIPQQIASTVFSSQHKIARGMDMIKIAEATKKGYAKAKVGDSINLSVPNSKTRRGRVGKGIAQTLDTGMQQYTLVELDDNLNGMVSYNNGKESKLDDRTLESEKELRKKDGGMFGLQENEKDRDPSQERRLARQQNRESRGDMSELPLSSAQSNKNMQIKGLQFKDEKVRLLRKARTEVQEVGKPKNGKGQSVLRGARIRRLTCLECERLQGFPDGWTSKGINEKGEEVDISDSQRYKTLGNAVTTNVIQAIAERLLI